jgi:hypothetical protein
VAAVLGRARTRSDRRQSASPGEFSAGARRRIQVREKNYGMSGFPAVKHLLIAGVETAAPSKTIATSG